ncbi:glutamine--fructose-6-phosphate transaminase (isomerizing) [Litorivicinus lipolyticus]|uniref:Glutamine--fructose-6-phosphate aminotransferase [isomerizing] n=1 Tax=Litorivicinus lipolyticus TaxID=418701 RepID=A0A5Q2QAP7_9GAMM|nr:glutamine--fructose-6-phosphate transaminase (isomerizing) [Litorivicinus lipolyticus]QGG79126.1 glutamine--fructose-6-phosphate transaminase (isomerizing) [Litorivicinus lipolyticus]
MCGIVAATAERGVQEILVEGLRRLEYRGYDSAGVAVHTADGLVRTRATGKVAQLQAKLDTAPLKGQVGIAHTRWATHGVPNEANAHPHFSTETIGVVHNGIIENHADIRADLIARGYRFDSDTDTEVVAHLVHSLYQGSLLAAVQAAVKTLRGAYALAVTCVDEPDLVVGARKGSPLVIGVGIGEHFLGSDQLALLHVTDRFIFVEENETLAMTAAQVRVYGADDLPRATHIQQYEHGADATDKAGYRHFMLKEIHEQPKVLAATLEGRVTQDGVLPEILGPGTLDLLKRIESIQIVACGTSYHAGLVARYWIESLSGLPCQVEIASEFRYRDVAPVKNSLFLSISQSGETADTLAALRNLGPDYLGKLAVCNVPGSSLTRESDLVLMTQAGPEIGVASTKAFTTQLIALSWLALTLKRIHRPDAAAEAELVAGLRALPKQVDDLISGYSGQIEKMAEAFADRQHALFLGRGANYPVAMEGALKLKEISYIHAEAYAAGELKHGPLALVDEEMPVVVVAPNDDMVEKLLSNLEEVKARGGRLYVFADESVALPSDPAIMSIQLPAVPAQWSAIYYTVPLQLLSYYVALLKGTDVDQPRNLAKSVTVE